MGSTYGPSLAPARPATVATAICTALDGPSEEGDPAKIAALHYDRYDGSYNFRPMRGGASLSMHSFACAIDWDANDNAFHDKHHLFNEQSLLVVKFKEEGWVWGGDQRSGDVALRIDAAVLGAD